MQYIKTCCRVSHAFTKTNRLDAGVKHVDLHRHAQLMDFLEICAAMPKDLRLKDTEIVEKSRRNLQSIPLISLLCMTVRMEGDLFSNTTAVEIIE